jgi:surfactin synthase thioesterase subunit
LKTLNLFCLAFAGGNKYSYRLLHTKAPSFINLITLEYPGRGQRIQEPLLDELDLIVNDLYQQIRKDIAITDYALYGHSMGALVVYLLALKLREEGLRLPSQIFLSGAAGPSAPCRLDKHRHLLPKNEFIDELKHLGGMPAELLNNDELLEFLEPILRNDFKAIETYQYKESRPLDISFTVITGMEEEIPIEEVFLWQKETLINVDFKRMPGNHFFIFDHSDRLLEIIVKKVYKSIAQSHEHRESIS